MSSLTFYRYSCFTLLFLVFLTPTIWIPGAIGVRLEELFVLLWVGIFALLYRQKKLPEAYLPLRGSLLIFFSVVIIVSITAGSLLQLPASILDLLKFIWLVKALVIYFMFFNYIYQKDGYEMVRREYILKWFVRFGTLSAILCFQQYFDLFGLNSLYIPIIAPTQSYTLVSGYFAPRVVGMVGNPNLQGSVLALCLICHTFLCLRGRGEFKVSFFILLFIALLMTLSRTAFITAVFGIFMVVFLYRKNIAFTIFKVIVTVLLLALLTMAYLVLREYEALYSVVFFRFENLSQGIQEGSFAARFDSWRLNIEYFLKSPVFGVGPLPRAGIFEAADGEWFLILRTYGIVGLIWLLVFFFWPFLRVASSTLEMKNLRVFLLSVTGAIFVYMIPAGIITNSITISFVLILLSMYDYPIYKVGR
ncbi:O-antigen ligase family protein [Paraneptunicella aestuarii]|uniref:O-antigen ligase family protein n=1 Tax=Paraneptunicella aestuarii TaxID=2831148 RepID=UPI001E5881AF|nr:O-antigen ligase family protein [Paraneptunicella aestuarii]UAA39644.1 O-antigen ligase family protein [Paraneptunicella aestuarii]